MSLTYLKEPEATYPDRLVPSHFPLKPLMPRRKYNVAATFTPRNKVPPEQHSSHSLPSQNKKPLLGNPSDQSSRVVGPLYSTPSSLSTAPPSLYASSNGSGISQRDNETKYTCNCPSRRVRILNLPSSQLNLFLDVLAGVGDIEQNPEFESENRLSLQFYDLRAAQKLAEVLPTIAPLAGVALHHVTLESDVCVLIDIPWGQSVNYDGLLVPLKQYGSVATLSFGKTLIGGPQQVVCVYHDVRDATKVLNKLITVNGVQLPVRLLSIPHVHMCPSINVSGRNQAQSSFSGIGFGTRESPPIPAAFASVTSTSMSPLASPYSTARSDQSSSYFSGAESPWIGNTKNAAADLANNGYANHSLKKTSPPLIGIVGTSRPNTNATSDDLDLTTERASVRVPASRSILEQHAGKEVFSGSYGPIGSTGTMSSTTTTGNSVFDSFLNKGPFGPLSTTTHDATDQKCHAFRVPKSLGSLEVDTGLADPVSSLKSADVTITRPTKSEDDNKSMNILKRFTDTNKKVDSKEPRRIERERCNDVNLEAIASGAETRTTVMLRNIPNKLDFKDLKRFLDVTNRCTYDFLYLRFDFMNRCNVGYAFISFTKPKHVATFVKARAGMKWSQYNYNSEKVIEIKFARIQGRESLIQKFRNSPVMTQDPAFKPRLYYTKGKLSGKEEPFPDPTTAISK